MNYANGGKAVTIPSSKDRVQTGAFALSARGQVPPQLSPRSRGPRRSDPSIGARLGAGGMNAQTGAQTLDSAHLRTHSHIQTSPRDPRHTHVGGQQMPDCDGLSILAAFENYLESFKNKKRKPTRGPTDGDFD